MQARVFDKVGKVAFSPCVFLTRPIVSPASLRIHQSVRVFDKVHYVFCKARVLISMFSTSSIVSPQDCVQRRVRGFLVSLVL